MRSEGDLAWDAHPVTNRPPLIVERGPINQGFVYTHPKDLLTSDAPKCGNCKHMVSVVVMPKHYYRHPLETMMIWRKSVAPPDSKHVLGKGACREPTLAESTQLFYVTDLSLCSLWEPKA